MTTKLKNQHSLSRKKAYYVAPVLAPEIAAAPVEWIENNLKGTLRNVLYEIVKYYNFTNYVFPSQITIAKKLGLVRETVNRAMAKLAKMGFIAWVRRFKNSNIYYIHPIFRDSGVRRELRFMFRVFYFMSITILSPLVHAESPVKQKVDNEYIYTKKSHKEEIRIISTKYNKTSGSQEAMKFRMKSPPSDENPESIGVRKGKIMEIRDPSKVKALNLTRAGQIKLGAFPPEAQASAMTELRTYDKPINDVFRFYWMLCKKYCDAHNIVPNHKEVFRLLQSEGLRVEAQGVDSIAPCLMETFHQGESHRTNRIDPRSTVDGKPRPKYGPYSEARSVVPRPIDPEREAHAKEELAKLVASGDTWAAILCGLNPIDPIEIVFPIQRSRALKNDSPAI